MNHLMFEPRRAANAVCAEAVLVVLHALLQTWSSSGQLFVSDVFTSGNRWIRATPPIHPLLFPPLSGVRLLTARPSTVMRLSLSTLIQFTLVSRRLDTKGTRRDRISAASRSIKEPSRGGGRKRQAQTVWVKRHDVMLHVEE